MQGHHTTKSLLVGLLVATLAMGALAQHAFGLAMSMDSDSPMEVQNDATERLHDCCSDSANNPDSAGTSGDLCDTPCASCAHVPSALMDTWAATPVFVPQYLICKASPHLDRHLAALLRPPQFSHS